MTEVKLTHAVSARRTATELLRKALIESQDAVESALLRVQNIWQQYRGNEHVALVQEWLGHTNYSETDVERFDSTHSPEQVERMLLDRMPAHLRWLRCLGWFHEQPASALAAHPLLSSMLTAADFQECLWDWIDRLPTAVAAGLEACNYEKEVPNLIEIVDATLAYRSSIPIFVARLCEDDELEAVPRVLIRTEQLLVTTVAAEKTESYLPHHAGWPQLSIRLCAVIQGVMTQQASAAAISRLKGLIATGFAMLRDAEIAAAQDDEGDPPKLPLDVLVAGLDLLNRFVLTAAGEQKDPIGGQLHAATILFHEGRRARDAPVAAALYFAACETLVGPIGDSNAVIQKVVAVLAAPPTLQADLREVRAIRNGIMHGGELREAAAAIRSVRRACARLLVKKLGRNE